MSTALACLSHDLTSVWLGDLVETVKPGSQVQRVDAAALCAAMNPGVDVVFLDPAACPADPVALVRFIAAEFPGCAVFVVMEDNAIESAAACIAAGAVCLVGRSADAAAVRTVLALCWPAPSGAAPSPVASGRAGFTAREIAILSGMADGLSNGEIGSRLYVSADTVKTQAKRLFAKLDVHDRAAAVAAGLRRGLIA